MNTKLILFLFLCCILAFGNSAKTEISDTENMITDTIVTSTSKDSVGFHYLGEIPPLNDPKIFAPDLIILENSFHIIIAFHPNGREIYWLAFNNENFKSAKINYVKFDGKTWSEPGIFKNTGENGVYSLHISPDGKRLYFTIRPFGKDFQIQYCERERDVWGKPKVLQKNINNVVGISSTFSGSLYADGIKRSQLKEGVYSEWESISSSLNIGKSTGGNPFISPDEDYIIFGQKTPSQMYISFQDKNENWTKPVNLNKEMHIQTASSQPIVSPDGKFLFYYVDDDKHLHWVSTDRIKQLQYELIK